MDVTNSSQDDRDLALTSPALPGGSLVKAFYDRTLMQLSDRGGASGIIGDRWADLCAEALVHDSAPLSPLDPNGDRIVHDTVVRLDDSPEVARVASRAHLQNPDFLLLENADDRQTIRAADAKFSVETAKSRQVSADVVRALLGPGHAVTDAVPGIREDATVLDGVFLCPDYSLTRYLLRGQTGLRRLSVPFREICLLPVSVSGFMDALGHDRLIGVLAARDDLDLDYRRSLLVSLYYLRLARAVVGFRLDQTRPMLGSREAPSIDLGDVEAEAERIGRHAFGAWNLVVRWNDIAEEVRRQRFAIDQATGFPIPGRILRQRIEQQAMEVGVAPPSTSKVRRIAGAWMRERIREAFGPIVPPVENMDTLILQLRAYSRSLVPSVTAYAEEVIRELIDAQLALEERTGLTYGVSARAISRKACLSDDDTPSGEST